MGRLRSRAGSGAGARERGNRGTREPDARGPIWQSAIYGTPTPLRCANTYAAKGKKPHGRCIEEVGYEGHMAVGEEIDRGECGGDCGV